MFLINSIVHKLKCWYSNKYFHSIARRRERSTNSNVCISTTFKPVDEKVVAMQTLECSTTGHSADNTLSQFFVYLFIGNPIQSPVQKTFSRNNSGRLFSTGMLPVRNTDAVF